MSDDGRNDGTPPGVTALPGASGRIDLDRHYRRDAIEYLEFVLGTLKEHAANGRPPRSVIVIVNGAPGIWTYSNTTDFGEQCMLFDIAKNIRINGYIGMHDAFRAQHENDLQKQSDNQGGPSNVVPFNPTTAAANSDDENAGVRPRNDFTPSAFPVPPPGSFRLVKFEFGSTPDEPTDDDDPDAPGPIAA